MGKGLALVDKLPRDWFQRLACLPGAFWLRDGETAYAGALPSAVSDALDPEPELKLPVFAATGGGSFPRWVGILPYESFRQVEGDAAREDLRAPPQFGAIIWQRYRAVIRVRGTEAEVLGESSEDTARLLAALAVSSDARAAPRLVPLGEPEADAPHEGRIRHALAAISRGELYQVNLARRLDFTVHGSALELLAALSEEAGFELGVEAGEKGDNWPRNRPSVELGSARCAFTLELDGGSVVSVSPEPFLRTLPGPTVQTTPIKGTRPRAQDSAEDRAYQRELEESDKEHAELTMVIDLERNDLGKIALPGSVIVLDGPKVVSHETVHHREATVSGILRPGISRSQLLLAMMPSGSVTGAPKRAAMKLIRELETERRGLYTGAHGYIAHDGGLVLSMAIRCLTSKLGVGHYFVGGGIVADSQPPAEVEETRWKARQLGRLLAPR